jgi:hypothetical protein
VRSSEPARSGSLVIPIGEQAPVDNVRGVDGPVVRARLPDGRVGVVLAAVMDGHPNPRARAASRSRTAWRPSGRGGRRDAVAGVEPLEGLLGLALWIGPSDLGVLVAGVQVAAEGADEVVEGPVLELMAAPGCLRWVVVRFGAELAASPPGEPMGAVTESWRSPRATVAAGVDRGVARPGGWLHIGLGERIGLRFWSWG